MQTNCTVVKEPHFIGLHTANLYNKLCTWRQNMPLPLSSPVGAQAPPCRRNVVLSNAEYVPTLTATAALRVKAALSKAAW